MWWKIQGFFRDANYYLFKAHGWKWFLGILLIIQAVRCGVELKRIPLAPHCSYEKTQIDLYNGITEFQKCGTSSKEQEELLCQLYRPVLSAGKTLSLDTLASLRANPATEREKLSQLFPSLGEESLLKLLYPDANVVKVPEKLKETLGK